MPLSYKNNQNFEKSARINLQAIVHDQGSSQNIIETDIPAWVPKKMCSEITSDTIE